MHPTSAEEICEYIRGLVPDQHATFRNCVFGNEPFALHVLAFDTRDNRSLVAHSSDRCPGPAICPCRIAR